MQKKQFLFADCKKNEYTVFNNKDWSQTMNVWVPLVVYLAVQSITPGPNNLTCLYLGGAYGLKGVRKFLTASMLGLFTKSFLCGSLNIVLSEIVPMLIGWLKWLGAAYMLFLAWQMARSGWVAEGSDSGMRKSASFKDGIILQLLNGKSWIASISAFAVYVIPISARFGTVLWVSLVFLLLALISSLIWALFGTSLKNLIARHRKAFGIVMGLSLVYCAVSAVL